MKYTITINQNRCLEWGLTASEAVVFSWIYELPSWADKLEYNGNTYYFGNRILACKELPIISDKVDTMYRLYKSLEKKGLISLVVLEKKDYISITDKGKTWHYENELPSFGKKSEESRKKIRENSEKNPTDQYTNNNKYTIDQKKEKIEVSIFKKKFDFKSALIELGIDENVVNDWLIVRKQKKAANTQTAFNRIKNEIILSGKSANECITIAVERSWQGFKAEWLKEEDKQAAPQEFGNTKTRVPLNPALHLIDNNGNLNDGTFIEDGYRCYFSRKDNRRYSIPPMEEPMPGINYEWTSSLGWHEYE